MFGDYYILALALLTTPAATSAAESERYVALRSPLQWIAIHQEVLDPREMRYILARPADFWSDLSLLRRRYRDLADAPFLQDSLRLPEREAVGQLLTFNRMYRQSLAARQSVELARWWALQDAINETDHLYRVWDAVRDARCEHYYVTVRRHAMKRLRTLVGMQAYYSGQFPPSVPIWRFDTSD